MELSHHHTLSWTIYSMIIYAVVDSEYSVQYSLLQQNINFLLVSVTLSVHQSPQWSQSQQLYYQFVSHWPRLHSDKVFSSEAWSRLRDGQEEGQWRSLQCSIWNWSVITIKLMLCVFKKLQESHQSSFLLKSSLHQHILLLTSLNTYSSLIGQEDLFSLWRHAPVPSAY